MTGTGRFLMSAAVAAMVATGAFAAGVGDPTGSLPAVSGANGKVDLTTGWLDGDGKFKAGGSWSIPLSYHYGVQFDALAGVEGNKFSGGFAGHVFRRDPSSYLLGAYFAYVNVGKSDVVHIGGEGEMYFDKISLEGKLGYEDTDIRNVGDDVFVKATAAYYIQDNLRVDVGYKYFVERNIIDFGFEYQTDFDSFFGTPLTVFGRVAFGDKSFDAGRVGVRLYFGGPRKSLIRRHREDDPSADDLSTLTDFTIKAKNKGIVCPAGTVLEDGSCVALVD